MLTLAFLMTALPFSGPDAPAATAGGDLKPLIEVLRKTGPDGKSSAEAARAWRELSKADVSRVPDLLAGMDGATSLARNWLRSALDRVLEQARAAQKPLPTAALQAYLLDTRHDAQARRLAYELLAETDKKVPDKYLPKMLDDPSPELRRDAVARLLEQAEKDFEADKKADALPLFRKCLDAAREKPQIDKAVRRLRDLGQTVDVPRHLGLVLDWKLIGPFPNPKDKGADTEYPPEKKLDPAGEYDGKAGKVRWKDYVTASENGVVDVYAALGQHVDAVMYALTEFTSPQARDIEIRLGCIAAFKLWVNGELVLVRGDAYTGMSFDHYVAQAKLKPGKNTILLKIILEEPPPPLPKICRFLLRVCDANGVAVLSTTRPPPPPPAPATEKKS